MGEHLQPGVVRQLDDKCEVGCLELDPKDVGARGQHPSGGHHLDHIHAARHPFSYGSPDGGRAVHLTAKVVAVAGRDGQGRPGGEDPRHAGHGSVPTTSVR